jgi:adenosylhomocysteinase
MAMHVEAKTANLVELLAEGGAEVAITGCNPLSTHDDVSAALDAHPRITSYAERGVDDEAYYADIEAVIGHEPTVTVDDGMDMVAAIHDSHPELIDDIVGGCEETTTGVHRLRAMDADGELRYPVFAVNDTPMKTLFDNVHGTGESALATIAMTTNLSWAGKTVVVAGYGYCGKGVAKKAAGQNADVVVTEVEPRRALEAHMEGYDVMPMREAAAVGDVFITTTGNRDVITREHFERMADGVLLANAGHFDVEVNLDHLSDLAVDQYEARDGVEAYELADGRRLNVLAAGRLVNLAAPIALGHPVEVMDQCARSSSTPTPTIPASTTSRTTSTARSRRSNSRPRGSSTTRSPTRSASTWTAGTTGRERRVVGFEPVAPGRPPVPCRAVERLGRRTRSLRAPATANRAPGRPRPPHRHVLLSGRTRRTRYRGCVRQSGVAAWVCETAVAVGRDRERGPSERSGRSEDPAHPVRGPARLPDTI